MSKKKLYCGLNHFSSSLFLRRWCVQPVQKLKPLLSVSLILSALVFPDWRLWPTDMGEISGAARNKGVFGSLFVCCIPPCFWFFSLLFVFSFCALLVLNVSPYPLFILFPFLASISLSSFWLSLLHLPLFFLLFGFLSPCYQFFSSVVSFNSFLSALLAGCHLPVSPLCISISISIPSSPFVFFSLFLWWVHSGEDVPLVVPQCTSAHPRCRLLDCDWLVWSLSSVAMLNSWSVY